MVTTLLLILHLFIALVLVGLVLLQRSEGGALGIGGGPGSFMSGRGAANVLTRATAGLAAAFFATSIALTVMARLDDGPDSVIGLDDETATEAGGLQLPALGIESPAPSAPDDEASPAPRGVVQDPAATTPTQNTQDDLSAPAPAPAQAETNPEETSPAEAEASDEVDTDDPPQDEDPDGGGR